MIYRYLHRLKKPDEQKSGIVKSKYICRYKKRAGGSLGAAKTKTPACAGIFVILASPGGFAYMPQAAESLASDSLQIPRVSRAGGSLGAAKTKTPAYAGIFVILASPGGFEPPYSP
jgi:hypothetical protein